MATFDRFDICEAYSLLECDYNEGGWLRERPSNQRRMESISVQLSRMGYRPGMGGGDYDDLTDNGKEIYLENVLKLKLPVDGEQRQRIQASFVQEWLQQYYPHVLATQGGSNATCNH